MESKALVPYLFRTEYSKIVSVLCKTFGLSQIEFAEDIASDTFLIATETWGLKGVPDNPKAWLYQVAKNKVKDKFRRDQIFQEKIKPWLLLKDIPAQQVEIDLSEPNIKDSQLQMLFAICNPLISSEAQIALALRILCGFGINEIAKAFLDKPHTIHKRLQRAKAKLKDEKINLNLPLPSEMEKRLKNVLAVLYLLFNEGYYSSTSEKNIRKELCYEAMRLTYLLLAGIKTNGASVNALMALFCFHASRFEARTDENGMQIIYGQQDTTLWDSALIGKGEYYLFKSAKQKGYAKYHLEAAIAYWHTKPLDSSEKWESILQLYNQLLQIEYSPITALNRTYALARANGVKVAIKECLKINLNQNHLYHLLLAELYATTDSQKQREHLHLASTLTDTKSERKWILEKLSKINTKVS